MTALTVDRVEARQTQCRDFLNGSAGQTHDKVLCKLNVSNKTDTFLECAWVPGSLRSANTLPESLASFGTPYFFRQREATFRFGTDTWPLCGCGGFLVQVTGSSLVILWPVQWNADMNVDMDNAWAWFGSMHHKDFAQFWDSECWHVLLDETEVVWIPYGYVSVQITLTSKDSESIWIPYVSPKLALELPHNVLASLCRCYEKSVAEASEGDELNVVYQPFAAWLRDMHRQVEASLDDTLPDDVPAGEPAPKRARPRTRRSRTAVPPPSGGGSEHGAAVAGSGANGDAEEAAEDADADADDGGAFAGDDAEEENGSDSASDNDADDAGDGQGGNRVRGK